MVEPAAPDPVRRPSRFALFGAALGSLGIPFLLVGPMELIARGPGARAATTILLLLAVLAVSMSAVATTRREPGAVAACLISVVGLVGVIVLAVASAAFG